MSRGAHREEVVALRLDVRLELFEILPILAQQVALVRNDELRPLGERGIVLLELRVDRLEILDGVAPLAARYVHQMQQKAAAVDVPQEIVPEARALRRALDDAGDVRHDEGHALVHVHDAEVREQGREVVVRDLRMRLAHDRQQRGLAHVRKADEAHVREELQFQRDVVALAGQAGLGKAWHLARRRGKVQVAPAAAAALCRDPVFPVGHVVHDGAGGRVAHEGAARHLDIQGVAVLAVAALAHAVCAVAGHIFALVAKVHERGHVVVHDKDHVAPASAVAAVGAARRDILLPVEGHRAVAALAGVDADARFIHK